MTLSCNGTLRITLTVTAGPHKGQVFTFVGHDTFIVGRSKGAHFLASTQDRYFSRVHFIVEMNPLVESLLHPVAPVPCCNFQHFPLSASRRELCPALTSPSRWICLKASNSWSMSGTATAMPSMSPGPCQISAAASAVLANAHLLGGQGDILHGPRPRCLGSAQLLGLPTAPASLPPLRPTLAPAAPFQAQRRHLHLSLRASRPGLPDRQ